MKLGLYLDMRNPQRATESSALYGQTLDLCEQAEELGVDSVWLSEHHAFADGYLPQPLVMAAAIAARTRRVRIGTAVLLAPLRSAALLAEEASIVDLISRGRLDLGLGAGYRAAEFALYGLSPDKPLDRLFERLRDIRALLTEHRVTPAPAQRPLPIWLGCNGPIGARRAGRAGEHLLSVRRRILRDYVAGLQDAGHDPAGARVSGPVNVFLSDDPRRDASRVAEAYCYLWDSYNTAALEGTGRSAPPTDPSEALRRGLAGGTTGLLVATPEEAAAQLGAHFRGMPIDTLFTWATVPGLPRAMTDRHIQAWSSDLATCLRDLSDGPPDAAHSGSLAPADLARERSDRG